MLRDCKAGALTQVSQETSGNVRRHFWLSARQKEGLLLASSGWGGGAAVKDPAVHRTPPPPPPTKNDRAQTVNRAKAESPAVQKLPGARQGHPCVKTPRAGASAAVREAGK